MNKDKPHEGIGSICTGPIPKKYTSEYYYFLFNLPLMNKLFILLFS